VEKVEDIKIVVPTHYHGSGHTVLRSFLRIFTVKNAPWLYVGKIPWQRDLL
jgi:hypothetical protein